MLLGYSDILEKKSIILASKSASRKKLLDTMFKGLKYTIVPSDFAEDLDKGKFDPFSYVKETCYNKLLDVRKKIGEEKIPYDLIICADTVCILDGKIIEKPVDSDDAYNMVSNFMGKTHDVLTVVYLLMKIEGTEEDKIDFCHEYSKVKIGMIPDESLRAYSKLPVILNCSGGYNLQAYGANFIESAEGCYNNIIGLPLYKMSYHIIQLMKVAKWIAQ